MKQLILFFCIFLSFESSAQSICDSLKIKAELYINQSLFQKAIVAYPVAITCFAEEEKWDEFMFLQSRFAQSYMEQQNYRQAKIILEYADSVARSLDLSQDSVGYANFKMIQGICIWGLGEQEKGIRLLSQSIETAEQYNYDMLLSLAYKFRYHVYRLSKRFDESNQDLKRYYEFIKEKYKGKILLKRANAAIDFAVNRIKFNSFSEANYYLEEGYEILKQLSQKDYYIALAYHEAGYVFGNTGRWKQELFCYEQGLMILDSMEEDIPVFRTNLLSNIGFVYGRIGDKSTAISYFRKALDNLIHIENPSYSIQDLKTVVALNLAHELKKDKSLLDSALHYLNYASSIIENNEKCSYSRKMTLYSKYSSVYLAKKSYQEMLFNIERAKEVAQKSKNLNTDLANVYVIWGLYYSGIDSINQAIKVFKEATVFAGKLFPEFITTRNGLAQQYIKAGQQERALEVYDYCYRYLQDSLETKKDLLALEVDYLNQYTELLLDASSEDMKLLEKALFINEKAWRKSRELLMNRIALRGYYPSLKAENKAYEYRLEILERLWAQDKDEKLANLILETFESAKNISLGLKLQQNKVLTEDSLFIKVSKIRRTIYYANLDESEVQKDSLVLVLSKLERMIHVKYPNYQLPPININELKRSVLGENEAVIEYSFTEKKLYRLFITKDSIQFKGMYIESLSTQQGYTLKDCIKKYKELLETEGQILEEKQVYYDCANNLYKWLLGDLDLKFIEKIYLVTDKSLSQMPFNALLVSPTLDKVSFAEAPYLIKHLRIENQYSMSIYQKLLEKRSNLAVLELRPLLIAPFYDELPGTRQEVDEILKLHPKGKILKSINKEELRAGLLNNKNNVLHLSTHGFADSVEAAYSGLWLNKQKLYFHELSTLKLSEVYLVVLSACSTNKGIYAAGEGSMTIARAFMALGVNATIANLWNINDQTSYKLMTVFYKNMKTGDSINEALQKAQLKFIKMSYSPYHWASWVNIGCAN